MYEIYLGVNCANFENFDQTKMEGFGYFPTDIRKLGKLERHVRSLINDCTIQEILVLKWREVINQ